MKKNLLTLLLIIFCSTVFTQTYSVDWGPEYRKQGGLFSSFFMAGMTGDNYHLIMQPKREKTLLSFDLDHKLIKNQDITFEKDGHKLNFNQFIQTSSGTFALFNANHKRQSDWKLYTSSFEDNKINDPQLTYQHSFDGKRYGGFRYQAYFLNNLELSPDKNKVSFVNVLDFKASRDNAEFAVAVFDQDMNLVWDKIQEINYPDKDFKLIQSVVNNDGSLFLLTKLFEPRPAITLGRSDGLPSYQYKIFRITENDMEEFEVKLSDNLLAVDVGIFIPENNDEEFILAGFYTTEEKRSGLNGLFLAHADTPNSQITSTTYPLDTEFLDGLISARDLRKERGLTSSFRIKDLLFFLDGSFSFIAEEYYTTERSYTDSNGNWKSTTIYHSDQMVIPRFDKDGELIHIEKIEKDFHSQSYSTISYSMAIEDGKIFLLYNDAKSREERREMRRSGNKGGYYTDMTVIDDIGEIEFQETLFSSKDIELVFMPRESVYSNGHLIILGVKGFGGKYYRCGTIDLF